jgi:acetyl esterase/lipase
VRIHGNVSDEDVNVIEVEHLVQALKAAGKDFEHEIYDLPGGHSFDRLDTPEAWKVRREIYRFLARHLKPPHPDVPLGITWEGRAAP